MKIFVSNLSFAATEADVKALFEGLGEVSAVVIRKEKKANKSRGFGFVDMPDDQKAQAAITALNDKEFMGRPLIVNPARMKPGQSWTGIKKESAPAASTAENFPERSERRPDRPATRTWHDPSFHKRSEFKGVSGFRRDRPSSFSGTARPSYKSSESLRSPADSRAIQALGERARRRQTLAETRRRSKTVEKANRRCATVAEACGRCQAVEKDCRRCTTLAETRGRGQTVAKACGRSKAVEKACRRCATLAKACGRGKAMEKDCRRCATVAETRGRCKALEKT